jgi:hypothetical protein
MLLSMCWSQSDVSHESSAIASEWNVTRHTNKTSHKSNVTQVERFTSQTSHKANVTQGKRHTSQTSHKANVSQGKRHTRQTSHGLCLLAAKQIVKHVFCLLEAWHNTIITPSLSTCSLTEFDSEDLCRLLAWHNSLITRYLAKLPVLQCVLKLSCCAWYPCEGGKS